MGVLLHSINSSYAQDMLSASGNDNNPTKNTTTDTVNISKSDLEAKWGIKISEDALPDIIKTHADDSTILNAKTKKVYLHGNTKIEFQDLKLRSAHTMMDNDKQEVIAYPNLDTAGKITSVQEFEKGTEKFFYDTLKYNFNSQRAVVRNARMEYGEGFIQSQQIKRNTDGSTFGWKNTYTTCNIPDHPHFAIRANRIKMIPDRMVASGPANLEIESIPTPIFFPFAAFPASKGQTSGFILPSYTVEANRGIGLQRGGYFFAINPHLTMIAQMDIFAKGSWGIFTTTQYSKRYKYSGSFSFNYSKTKWGEEFEINRRDATDFKILWTHVMDPKARPGTSFSASVDVGSNTYNLVNGRNANTVLNNQFSSSIAYGKTWANKPYNFTAAIRHSQNTQTGLVSVNIPDLNFNLGQFSPFQRKIMIGTPKWYEKITVSYNVQASNRWVFYDSTLNLNRIKFNDFDNGIRHSLNIQGNYNILRFFTLSINVPYNEYWNTKQQFFSNFGQPGGIDTLTKHGFFATRDFSLSASMNTRIYGMKMFKKGNVQGIRHVIMPNVGVRYTPSFAASPFDYMYSEIDANGRLQYYSPYTGSPIGGPNNFINRGEITYGLNNTLQMKMRQKDSTAKESKIISLIDGLNLTGSYNLFADTNKLSDFNLSFRTSILSKFNISANSTFTPYHYEGRFRTRYYLWDTDKKLVQMNNANLTFGISFDGTNKDRGTAKDSSQFESEEDYINYKNLMKNGGYDDYYDFNIPWNLSLNGGIRINRNRMENKPDSFIFTPNFTFSGGFNLTERWKINVTSGLDFANMKQIRVGYTMIDISRDLHCWQMSLNIVPFGQLRSFFFSIQVKASVLQDLKLTRRRSFQDNF